MRQRCMQFVSILGMLVSTVACAGNPQQATQDDAAKMPYHAAIFQAINTGIETDNHKYPDLGDMPTTRPSEFSPQEKEVLEQGLLRQRTTLRSSVSIAQKSVKTPRTLPSVEATDSPNTPMTLPMVANTLKKKLEQDSKKRQNNSKAIPSLGGQPPKNQRE